MTNVFVSYSHKDKIFASMLAEELRSYGIGTWVDELEMRPGDHLFDKISREITKSDFLIVILSPNSVNSEWVKHEVYLALAKEVSSKQIKVVPLLYSQCEVPPFLREKIWADFITSFSEGLVNLLRGICRNKEVFKYTMNGSSILEPNSETIEQVTSFLIKNDHSKIFLLVYEDNGFVDELKTIWWTDKELKEKGFPDSFIDDSMRARRAIPFLIKNYSLILPKYIYTAFKYLGRDVGTSRLISQSIGTLTKKLFLLISRRISRYCELDKVKSMHSIDGKNLLDEFEKASVFFDATIYSFPAYVFGCDPDNMLYLGLAGCKDSTNLRDSIYDVTVVVPREAVLSDTLAYLGKVYPLPPDPEITSTPWIKYFMPEIAYGHIVGCSYSGQFVTKYLNRVGFEKSDYNHFGYQ